MGYLRGKVTLFAVLGILAISVGALMGRASVPGLPVTTTATQQRDTTEVSMVRVHVSGMVVAPGVVDVPPNAIVADAIEAAGGLRSGAVVDQINLAAPVAAGEQIVVPGPGNPGVAGVGAGEGPISLNRATAADLETLPGVGPVLAGRIVTFREKNGRFEVVEDLLEVPGIGEAKLDAIRDLVKP